MRSNYKYGLSLQWLVLLISGVVFIFVLDFFYVKISKSEFVGKEVSPGEVLGVSAVPYKYEASPPNSTSAYEKSRGTSFLLPKRITLSHNDGSRDKKRTDYSTLALLFASEYRLGHFMPLVDIRGHRFDNDRYAANVGVGGRYVPDPDSFCELLGVNAYYDYRQGSKGNYHQLGVGLEILGKRWDFRANGYIPVGHKKITTKCVFDDYIGNFRATQRECEFTSYSYNAEVGYLIVRSNTFLFYAAAGPYYLSKKSSNRSRGGTARIRPQYKDYIALDLSVSYDKVFKTVYEAAVIVYLPLYQISSKKSRHAPCGITDRQVYQPIERFEIMPLGKSCCWKANF